jgi:hypothetical protein
MAASLKEWRSKMGRTLSRVLDTVLLWLRSIPLILRLLAGKGSRESDLIRLGLGQTDSERLHSMDVKEKALYFASLWEQCADVLKNSGTDIEIRAGFLKCSEILSSNPNATEFVRRLQDWSQRVGSSLADFELVSARDGMIHEFDKAAAFMHDTAEGLPPENNE